MNNMDHLPDGNIVSNGVKIHFSRAGVVGKPPLVLVHGFTDNGLCWSRTRMALERDFDIVMVDSRNHGQSGPGEAGIGELAADLAAVVTALGFDRCFVLGHSVGASIATGFAGNYPRLVSRLILEDPPWTKALPDDEDDAVLMARRKGFRKYVTSMKQKTESEIMAYGKSLHTTWHEDEFPAWAESKKQVLPEAMDLLDTGDWTELVPKIACPALLLYADNDDGFDGMVTEAMAGRVEGLNANIKVHHVKGAGHNLRREQFGSFIAAVREFLAE